MYSETTKKDTLGSRRWGWLEAALVVSLLLLLAQLFPSIKQTWDKWPSADTQVSGTFWHQTSSGGWSEIRYCLYLPKDYGSNSNWPLLLNLHGSGDRGSDLSIVRKHGLPAMIDKGKKLPMIVVSPQCHSDLSWNEMPLPELLEEMQRKFHVDQQRIYVIGYSMGGFGAWNLAEKIPDQLAAIIPICGGGNTQAAANLVNLPIWAFHGQHDNVVPTEATTEMVTAIEAAGSKKVRMTIFPNEKHGIYDKVLKHNEMFDWLMAQKNSKSSH
jgi:predicted peptidase